MNGKPGVVFGRFFLTENRLMLVVFSLSPAPLTPTSAFLYVAPEKSTETDRHIQQADEKTIETFSELVHNAGHVTP